MLHTLDRTINTEIRRISTQCRAVSQRERGDEMVVVAASATDALTVTLSIIDYFAKTNVVDDPALSTQRRGDAAILPAFKISAGIAGGNTSIPLIITEQGNLSGFLLNTGARLQSRANELSPKESRVMVTKQVFLNYTRENALKESALFQQKKVYFFDAGMIEFKGVMLPSCEAIFNDEDRYKEKFSEEMGRLYSSTRESHWEQRIYQDAMDLVSKSAQVMPPFRVTPPKPVHGMVSLTNDSLMRLCLAGKKAYLYDEDYSFAISLLHRLIDIIQMIPQYDRLILDYIQGIADKYDLLLKNYEDSIDQEIDEKAGSIFNGDQYKAYFAAKKGMALFEKLRRLGRKSPLLTKKKTLWFNLIKQYQDRLEFTLYSGKK
jgi:hypothetical protein